MSIPSVGQELTRCRPLSVPCLQLRTLTRDKKGTTPDSDSPPPLTCVQMGCDRCHTTEPMQNFSLNFLPAKHYTLHSFSTVPFTHIHSQSPHSSLPSLPSYMEPRSPSWITRSICQPISWPLGPRRSHTYIFWPLCVHSTTQTPHLPSSKFSPASHTTE